MDPTWSSVAAGPSGTPSGGASCHFLAVRQKQQQPPQRYRCHPAWPLNRDAMPGGPESQYVRAQTNFSRAARLVTAGADNSALRCGSAIL